MITSLSPTCSTMRPPFARTALAPLTSTPIAIEERNLTAESDTTTPPFADSVSSANFGAICSLPAVSRRPDRTMRRKPSFTSSKLMAMASPRWRERGRTGLRCYCYRKLQRRRMDWHVVRVRRPTFLTQRIDLQGGLKRTVRQRPGAHQSDVHRLGQGAGHRTALHTARQARPECP